VLRVIRLVRLQTAGRGFSPDKAQTCRRVFKFAGAAERSWRRLDGHNQLPKLIIGVKFTNEIGSSDRNLAISSRG
jgi:hypothetical protein